MTIRDQIVVTACAAVLLFGSIGIAYGLAFLL